MEVTVKPKSLRKSAGALKGIAVNIDRSARMIQQAACNLDTCMSAYSSVAGKLNNYSDGIETLGKKVKKLGRAGVKISYMYEDADSESAEDNNVVKKVAWDVAIGALGPLGGSIEAVKALDEGNYGKAAGKLIELVGDVSECVTEDGEVEWRKLFQLDKVEDPVGAAKEKLTSKVAWAAAIVENGWENYKEHGGFTARYFEETGVESAIDIGEAFLIGVGIGAAVTAAGITAPGWALAAAGVGVGIAVDAGLNWVVKKATGNPDADWKESVSDFVCDAGEASFRGAKKLLNSAVKGIKKSSSFVKWGHFSLGNSW